MSVLLHLRNYGKVSVVFKTTSTSWFGATRKFRRLYCSNILLSHLNGLPENNSGEILHNTFENSSEVKNSVAFGSDADTFGTLKKSLEKVSREERRKKLEIKQVEKRKKLEGEENERRSKFESEKNESSTKFRSKQVKTMD